MATAYSRGLPLPLRNALAELVIGALQNDGDASALAWLAAAESPAPPRVRRRLAALHLVDDDGTLMDVHLPHRDAAHRHAVRALRAAEVYRSRPAPGGAIERAAAQAAVLWNQRLFFEVHEVLEAVWKTANGATRQALQGLIQIGVALHHHAHGNVRGARTLMHEGRDRLAATRGALPTVDVDALLAATTPWDDAFAAGTEPPAGPPPPLLLM